MPKILLSVICLAFCFKGVTQVPSSKETIQHFIDSIGKSGGKQLIETSVFPAVANGKNYKWKQKIWRNHKKEILWIETIIPGSTSTVYFYCRDTLIFISEHTKITDSITNKRTDLFRNIYIYESSIIEDSAPGRNNNTLEHYLQESKTYLERAKLAE